MRFDRGKPAETPNAPYRAARMKDERWRSVEPGFEPGRAGPWLTSSPLCNNVALRVHRAEASRLVDADVAQGNMISFSSFDSNLCLNFSFHLL
jgi:hypothetical protein